MACSRVLMVSKGYKAVGTVKVGDEGVPSEHASVSPQLLFFALQPWHKAVEHLVEDLLARQSLS